jgi:predicted nucleotidyltransferase component of viral defense system
MTPKSFATWIAGAPDKATRELRQAVHTILAAVSTAPRLPRLVVLKGGILLALAYGGDRFTKDVDFSMREKLQEIEPASLVEELRASLALQVEALDHGLDCRVQGFELQPTRGNQTWPTLKIRVGYAPKADLPRHRRLINRQATTVVSLDISYNEVITAVYVVAIPGGGNVQVSTLADVVAEKYRAMLQQPIRNRERRQDVYDLYRLLPRKEMKAAAFRAEVLAALVAKSEGKGLNLTRDSIADPEVRSRSKKEYALLKAEIASDLPAFDETYSAVQAYYEQLPWL